MKIPHACPICNGTKEVPAGFYSHGITSTSASPETCRSCQGTGVVWQEQNGGLIEGKKLMTS